MNNFALLSDMKVARNRIYEYHSCYSGRKDNNFINKTLQVVNEMVSRCVMHATSNSMHFRSTQLWSVVGNTFQVMTEVIPML